MKSKVKSPIFIIVILAFLVIIIMLVVFLYLKSENQIEIFEKEFGLKLPKETSVILSERNYGAMGDGHSIYIYQLSSKDMNKVIKQQSNLINWSVQPINKQLSISLRERIY